MLIPDTVFSGVKSSKYFAKVNPKQDRQETKFFNLCKDMFKLFSQPNIKCKLVVFWANLKGNKNLLLTNIS